MVICDLNRRQLRRLGIGTFNSVKIVNTAFWRLGAAATLVLAGLITSPVQASQAGPAVGTLSDGDIVLFRHAIAPGGGDPPGFKLADCRTQRNLDDQGRAQARRIGQGLQDALRERGTHVAAVWTSQWCRTRETAALAFPQVPSQDVPAFNSFFAEAEKSEPQTRAAQALLSRWAGPGVLVVVTHQVNITALTDIVPPSGEGIMLRWRDGRWHVLGRLTAP